MFMKWLMVSLFPDKRNKREKWRCMMVIVMCGILMPTSGCTLLSDEEQEEVLPTITSPTISKKPEYIVEQADWISTISASGKVMSEQEEILFFQLDNKSIKEVLVKNGDTVKAGQTLLVLDTVDFERELVRKKLDERKLEVDMKAVLRKKDEMDPAQFEEEKRLFEQSRQFVRDLQNDIAKATIKAPFDGIVVNLMEKKGNMSKKNNPVITIANTARLAVALDVPKEDLQKVVPGMDVELSINSVDQKLKGKVKTLPAPSPSGNNQSETNANGYSMSEQDRIDRYVIVELSKKLPANVTRGLPLGATIIIQKRNNVMHIPPSALRTSGPRTYVQVVEKDRKFEVDVEVGERDATKVEIKKGLTPGQKVVGH